MAVVIKVAGWRAEGLRCPDHQVSFLKDKDGQDIYPVSLIQMPNGTGKTTTLELLRAALSGDALTGKGSAQEWSVDKVQSFQKRNSQSSSGQFLDQPHWPRLSSTYNNISLVYRANEN